MKNSMKTPDQKKRSKQLGKEIQDSRKRYEDLRVHGGSDPFWSDGVNMNLCRSHVMYFRKQVETEPDPDPIEEKAMQILETAKPVPIQMPERLFDKERIKELEKDLIRAEAERDVFQKLYKEQLAIS